MPFSDLKREILDQDMCTPCGACVAVCPSAWLTLSKDQVPIPTLAPDALSCGSCTLCLDVCPGRDTATPAAETRLFGRTRTREERWTGIFRESLHLTSIEPRVRASAAAGGAGSSLLLAALRSKLADAVIVIGRDAERPWVPAALITDDEDMVIRCAQTSYCITPNLQRLRDAGNARVALVGVPCEIQAIRKMQGILPCPPAADKVVLTLEIACASNTKLAGTEHLITQKLGIPLREVRDVRYRDGEYPGEFAVRTADGTRHTLPFHELVDEFKKFKTHRCLTCGDWWSGIADVSISDGDPNIYASSQSGAKMPRQSKVMVRTARGEEIVRLAVDLGMVQVTPSTFVPEENLGLQRKRFRHAAFMQSMPDRVPTPPVDYTETDPLLTDAEVITRMNQHRAIRSVATLVEAGPSSALRISASPTAVRKLAWRPPGDKAITQRAALAAALAEGTSVIHHAPHADDVEGMFGMLRQLSIDVWEAADGSFVIKGLGLRGLTPPSDDAPLDAGNSATSARLLLAVLAGTPGRFCITGNALLRRRPMAWIVDPLRRAGADITYEADSGCLPVRVHGRALNAIVHEVGIDSAQPVSALLFAGLQANGDTRLRRRVKARDHTERLLRHLGVAIEEQDTCVHLRPPMRLAPFEITVPGDISTAALPIACTIVSPFDRCLIVEHVGINETRMGFVRTLQAMGADIEVLHTGMQAGEPTGTIIARSGRRLRGVNVSGPALMQSMIDELPLLAAIAARAEGQTTIHDASELKDKDTDRIATTIEALRPFGVRIDGHADGFTIDESIITPAASLALPPDHRVIFAAMALASSLEQPSTVTGWERVSVSFRECLPLLEQLASVVQPQKA